MTKIKSYHSYILAIISLILLLNSGATEYSGKSSFYYKPQNTASGKYFRPQYMWCAHKTLPLGTILEVTNPKNGKSVKVTVWDRGPYIRGRVLDLSKSAFAKIANTKRGVIQVKYRIVGRARK
jgi:rare lipoprotein A